MSETNAKNLIFNTDEPTRITNEAEFCAFKDKFQKVYGPLTINYPCNKWRWLEEPLPWERGNY